MVLRLRRHLDGGDDTISGLAKRSGVNRTTIYDLLSGQAYIDVVTLARLEHAVGARLWPETIGRDVS